MAATTAMQVKQLGELLKEQQEPFILETYLSERGCTRRNSLTSDSSQSQRKCANLNKRRNGSLLHCPKIFRAVYSKLCLINKHFRVKNSDETGKICCTCANENGLHGQENAEQDRFSSASSTNVYNSCSEIDIEQEYDQGENKIDTDGKLQWRSMENSKDHSPVSMLEDINFLGGSQFQNKKQAQCAKQITEGSILSASLWNILLHSATEVQGFVWSNSSSQCFMTKQVLQHNSQILFDCVREITETHQKEERRQKSSKKFLGSEEIGKLICKKINAWGTQTADKSTTKLFADLDFSQEWIEIEEQKNEIRLEVGDEILEKITDEIIIEMVSH